MDRKYDAVSAGIRAVKCTKNGLRLTVAVVFDNADFSKFKNGDMIENLLVPGMGVLSGASDLRYQGKAGGDPPHSFEFVAQYCGIETEPPVNAI